MTTIRQVKQIYRTVLARHRNLKEMDVRFFCMTPVHHFVRGVYIERTSDGDRCEPWWTVTALFLAEIDSSLCMGTYIERLRRPKTSLQQSWRWSDPRMMAEAIDVIETEALPKLHIYGTPEGYITLPSREHWIHYEPREDRMIAHIAAGDLETARAIWFEREPVYRGKSYHPDSLLHRWQMQLAAVAEPLHAGDRQALAKILHGWEQANVRGTSIERYWESTPFPLELSDG